MKIAHIDRETITKNPGFLKVTKKPGFQPLFRRYIFRKASSLPSSLLGLSVFFSEHLFIIGNCLMFKSSTSWHISVPPLLNFEETLH